MDPVTLLAGAIVSVLVQAVKKYAGTSSLGTAASLVVLSLIGGASLYFLKQYGLWESVLQVLVYAGAAYGLIIKNAQEVVASYSAK
jgi:hypothetical protein